MSAIVTPAHFVRHNKTSRAPRRWVYLDTEAHIELGDTSQRQRWRLGVTCFESKSERTGAWSDGEWNRWDDPVQLWSYISELATPRARTVVLAHNLGYDLRISRALLLLPSLGWKVDLFTIGGRSVTMTLRRDGCSLVLCDFTSWIPRKLDDIGAMVGLSKLPLPAQSASQEVWYARCERDVEILRRANRDILGWITSDDMGNWQRSGAGFAYSNWRHRHLTDRVLVHQDSEARLAELAAIGTGRCEAWRHGDMGHGPHQEWDLPSAYARVGLDTELPTMLQGHDLNPSWDRWRDPHPGVRVLCHASVENPQPTLAIRTDRGWVWPVGHVEGWWWDTELRNAELYGATIESDRAIFYQGTYALRDWAQWIVPYIEDPRAGATEVRRAVAKHMSRALIGRYGAKYPRWDKWCPANPGELELHGHYDADTDRLGRMLTVAGQTYLSLEEEYVADACPALLGAIMAECRVRLWAILTTAGLDHVLYCDTDSVIVDRIGARNLRQRTEAGELWGLRIKARHKELEVLGPRQLILGQRGRIAGVDSRATRIDKSTFSGERWDGLTTTLQSGTPDVVVVRSTTWTVTGRDPRRRHVAGGRTRALVATAPPVTGQ